MNLKGEGWCVPTSNNLFVAVTCSITMLLPEFVFSKDTVATITAQVPLILYSFVSHLASGHLKLLDYEMM